MEAFQLPWPVEHSPTSTDCLCLISTDYMMPCIFTSRNPASPSHPQCPALESTLRNVWDKTRELIPRLNKKTKGLKSLVCSYFLFKFWSISFQSYVVHTETHSCDLIVCTTLCPLVTAFSTLKILPEQSFFSITIIGHQMSIM